MTDDFDAKLAGVENAVVRDLNAEIERLRNDLFLADQRSNFKDQSTAMLVKEREALRVEMARLRQYVAHNDEEYLTMKDVLRAEHKACCEMRPIVEAAKVWRKHECFKTATLHTPRCPCQSCALVDAIDAANRAITHAS